MYSVPQLTTVRTVEYGTGSYKDKGDVRKDPNLTTPKISRKASLGKKRPLWGQTCISFFDACYSIQMSNKKGIKTFIVA